MRAIIKSMRSSIFASILLVLCLSLQIAAQQTSKTSGPVIVRPGAPGQPTQTLPSTTKASLPLNTTKDVEFMRGMIMHHAQAVEMTAMIDRRTQNKDVRLLGARISQSQTDEINFMKNWLAVRGEENAAPMPGMKMSHSHGSEMADHKMLMPGMLSEKQMDALRRSKGTDFDKLFLTGMIQHHTGALTMVKEMFDTAGAGQDAELFNFASDVDSGQRAEIKRMQTLLEKP